MKTRWTALLPVIFLLATAGIVFAGTKTYRLLQTDPSQGSYETVNAEYIIKPIGWRNVNVVGGSTSQNITTEQELATIQMVVTNTATTPVSVVGEAGYEVIWTGTGTPPLTLEVQVNQSVTFGGAGAVKFESQNKFLTFNLTDIPEVSGSGISVFSGLKTVPISLANGQYRGEIWLSSGEILATNSSASASTFGSTTFFVTRKEAEDEPQDSQPQPQPQQAKS